MNSLLFATAALCCMALCSATQFSYGNNNCYRQAAIRECTYGQATDSHSCRLNRCNPPPCSVTTTCPAGKIPERGTNGRCGCVDSGIVCPPNDCDLRTAESLLLDPPCRRFIVNPRTGCESCECECGPRGECRDLNCEHGQLHNGDGCRLCECRECEDLDCVCEFGSYPDVFGCDTCNCKPNPDCPHKVCEHGFKKDRHGRSTCECNCPPVCAIFCPFGNVIEDGCATCECKPNPDCPHKTCDNGFVVDSNGVPTCRCQCADLDCGKDCEFGYVKDNYGCDTCECEANQECPYKVCEHGFKKDRYGRSTCECNCPPLCDIYCPFGNVVEDGCPICECKPNPDCPHKQCPNGFVKENHIPTCECECEEHDCNVHCEFGYVKDEYHCDTCECKPNPHCPTKVCQYGFKKVNGRTTCDCKCPPTCRKSCQFGFVLDDDNCATCECANNPDCPYKTCDYGFKKDAYNRPTCDCKCRPVPESCSPRDKACKYGFQEVDGCETCECNPIPEHSGSCPRPHYGYRPSRTRRCEDDGDCQRDEKCCRLRQSGSKVCADAHYRPTTTSTTTTTHAPVHPGRCPHFQYLDLTQWGSSNCSRDSECEWSEKCCRIGGIKRCVTTANTPNQGQGRGAHNGRGSSNHY